jgi:CubicO group peptidase (beta-lactamase class C family)
MAGPPPFAAGSQVTLANWQDPPFNRWSFQHVRELIPTARIRSGRQVRRLPSAQRDLTSVSFRSGDRELTVGEMLAESYTDGFLVLHRGRIVTESYWNGMTADTPHLLMSVSKSVVSTVAGILVGRGLLDVSARLERILPELAGTSFAGATVRDLLDMRAGTHFDEIYDDRQSDVVRLYERVYQWRPHGGEAGPADALAYYAMLDNDGPHGGAFRYRSILTDVLGWVLERAGGARLHELISALVWQPMGAEFDADITLDAHGNAMADGGISATLRDLGRFGLLFAGRRPRSGRWDVVPEPWIGDTIAGAPDGPEAFIAVEPPLRAIPGMHYRNCWWVAEPAVPFFYAAGINGQNVFVHQPSQVVIAKLSTWPTALHPVSVVTLDAAMAIAAALASGQT